MTYKKIIDWLQNNGNVDIILEKEKRFGIVSKNALGIYQKDLKLLIKGLPKESKLAMELYGSGIYEARILCSKLYEVDDLTEALMEEWVVTFENWEICDTFSMGLFAKSKYAVTKAIEWSRREREFEKRAGFVIMAAYCMADKKASNETFEQFFPIIVSESHDNRIYVKKAINWALRNIGKRNIDLNKQAISVSKELIRSDDKSTIWIGKDACKELEGSHVNILDYPRSIYRK